MWPECSLAKALGCCSTRGYRISCLSFLRVLDLPPTYSILGESYVCLADSKGEESLVKSGVRCFRCRCDEEGKLMLRVESDEDHFIAYSRSRSR